MLDFLTEKTVKPLYRNRFQFPFYAVLGIGCHKTHGGPIAKNEMKKLQFQCTFFQFIVTQAVGIAEKSNDHVYNVIFIVYRFVSLKTTESCHDGTSVEEGMLFDQLLSPTFSTQSYNLLWRLYLCTQTYQHPEQDIFRTRAWDG